MHRMYKRRAKDEHRVIAVANCGLTQLEEASENVWLLMRGKLLIGKSTEVSNFGRIVSDPVQRY